MNKNKKKYLCYQNIAANRYNLTCLWVFSYFFLKKNERRRKFIYNACTFHSAPWYCRRRSFSVIVSEEDTKILQTRQFFLLYIGWMYILPLFHCSCHCWEFLTFTWIMKKNAVNRKRRKKKSEDKEVNISLIICRYSIYSHTHTYTIYTVNPGNDSDALEWMKLLPA